MHPRKKLHIFWSDILYAGIFCITKYSESIPSIKRLWSKSHSSVVGFTIRTLWDAYLQQARFPAGSEIIMSGMTIHDMYDIVKQHGLVAIPLDLDLETLTAPSERLVSLITPKTKAVVFAHLFGTRANLDALIKEAHKNNIYFIEDCAQTYTGDAYRGHSDADISLFSFGSIKTSSALGGAIATTRDLSVHQNIQELLQSYPIQKRWIFFKKLFKYGVLKLLSYPLLYGLFTGMCHVLGKDYDRIIAASTRAFSGTERTALIRQRLSFPQQALLERKLVHSFGQSMLPRIVRGDYVRDHLPPSLMMPGAKAMFHSYWVCPVLSQNPDGLVAELRKHGFDATTINTSMEVLPSMPGMSAPKNLLKLQWGLVYLPVYPELPESALCVMLSLLESRIFLMDAQRFRHAYPAQIVKTTNSEELQKILLYAQNSGQSISIMGMRHNGGSHAFRNSGILVDMRQYNDILSIDPVSKKLRVQSGATWDKIQHFLHPYGLSVKTMQSSPGFTVGGSISSNIHSRSIMHSTIIGSIESFRILIADGSIQEIDRDKNPELFSAVIGGYGLLGIILDCTLHLSENIILRQAIVHMPTDDMGNYAQQIWSQSKPPQYFFARHSTAPSSLLRESITSTWKGDDVAEPIHDKLTYEKNVLRDKFFMLWARHSSTGKEFLWRMERWLANYDQGARVSQTNLSRPPLGAHQRTVHSSMRYTETIHEYFIPPKKYAIFVEKARLLIVTLQINVLRASSRIVSPDKESLLSYVPSLMISFMFYCTCRFVPEDQERHARFVEKLTEVVLELGGTYYLTYHDPIQDRFVSKGHPNIRRLLAIKKQYDPKEIFQSEFYRHITLQDLE